MVVSFQQAPTVPFQNRTSWLKGTGRRIAYQSAALKRIIISDDIELVEKLQATLSCAGYQISVIHDGLRGLLAVKRLCPDLIVVDWEPPRLTGLDICSRLKTNNRGDQPIILLTRGEGMRERIAGFEAGADDCISMPFIEEEFVARIRTRITGHRRTLDTSEAALYCANIVLNRKTRKVFRNDRLVRLVVPEKLLQVMPHRCFGL